MTRGADEEAIYRKWANFALMFLVAAPYALFLFLPPWLPGYYLIGGVLVLGQLLSALWLPDRIAQMMVRRSRQQRQKN